MEAHFVSQQDISFSSFLKPHTDHYHHHQQHQQQQQQRGEGADVISLTPPRLSSVTVSSSVETTSNYGARTSQSSYRTRSFRATPTASSEASWNSQAGLLPANPLGSDTVVNKTKILPNNNNSRVGSKWARIISPRWLIKGRKCPCSCKKAVQVEDRMVINRRKMSTSSSTATNSFYSSRQTSPNHLGTNNNNNNNALFSTLLPSLLPNNNSNSSLIMASNNNNNNESDNNNNNNATNVVPTRTSNGFTFPILENQSNGLKEIMFNNNGLMIPSSGGSQPSNEDEQHRDLLEVVRSKSQQSPKSRRTSYEDENVSDDGSSDLFEIESFSTISYPHHGDSIEEIVVIGPSSNSCSPVNKVGIKCSGYNNQDRSDNNNNNNNNNNINSKKVGEGEQYGIGGDDNVDNSGASQHERI